MYVNDRITYIIWSTKLQKFKSANACEKTTMSTLWCSDGRNPFRDKRITTFSLNHDRKPTPTESAFSITICNQNSTMIIVEVTKLMYVFGLSSNFYLKKNLKMSSSIVQAFGYAFRLCPCFSDCRTMWDLDK